MSTDNIVSASILSANLATLGEDVNQVIKAGADWIHFDVMDNHYVPNLSFGPEICRSLRNYGIKNTIDVHLMVEPVDSLIQPFANAGADYITFHPESTKHLDRTIQLIIDNGCKPGLAFNPSTPLNYLEYIIEKLDLILIMSVNPGFGGQSFLSSTLDKIIQAKHKINASLKKNIRLAVDGGITNENISYIKRAGANTFISGSYIFNSNDYASAIKKLKD